MTDSHLRQYKGYRFLPSRTKEISGKSFYGLLFIASWYTVIGLLKRCSGLTGNVFHIQGSSSWWG